MVGYGDATAWRYFDEATCCEEFVCVILDKAAIDYVAVHEDWLSTSCTWSWNDSIVLGKD
jgi:hypothetical protein